MASDLKMPEFEPPQACVNRAVKTVLPDSVQITKEARAAFTRAAGVFIFYLTNCANDICKENKRQTIFATDILHALRELDFEEFEKPLEEFLEQYRKEIETNKKTSKSKKSADITVTKVDPSNTDTSKIQPKAGVEVDGEDAADVDADDDDGEDNDEEGDINEEEDDEADGLEDS